MRRDQRSAEAQRYRKLYNTRRWRKVRADRLAKHPLCERCLAKGRVVPATVCHHVDPSTKESPETFFDGPFASLCGPCHDGPVQSEERLGYSSEVGEDGWPLDPRHPVHSGELPKHWGFSIPHGLRRSAVPVVLVCGAPASGKSTYVQEHATSLDMVIDFDLIRQRFGGKKWDQSSEVTGAAFAYRAKMLYSLEHRREGRCWLIVTAPTQRERNAWCKALGNVTVHVLSPGKLECIRRIKASPERAHTAREQIQAVERWYWHNPEPAETSKPGRGARKSRASGAPLG